MYNILVTGVGAIIGYGIIRSLHTSRYPVKIVGMDIYSDAVGQNWCDNFEKAILASVPEYPEFIKNVIQKYQIDLVIPGIEQDIMRMAKESNNFQDFNTKFVLNNLELLTVADDKWLTHLKLLSAGFPTIKTYIDGSYSKLSEELGVPFLLKPRKSYASKGIFKLYNEEDFLYWKNKLGDNFMVQEIVGDDNSEYTVGLFGFGDGTSSHKLIFQRKLSGEGATVKAKVRIIPELDNVVDRLVKVFKPIGPTNLQFRYHQGQYLLLEINPRISSSTSLRTAFGFNDAEMCILYYLEGLKPQYQEIRMGYAVRYIEDMIIYDSDTCRCPR